MLRGLPHSNCAYVLLTACALAVSRDPSPHALTPSPGPRVANAYGELVPMRKGTRGDQIPAGLPANGPEEVLDWRTAPPPVQGAGPAPEPPVLGEPGSPPLPAFPADDEVATD